MSRLAPNLLVTADDFGLGLETSRGILDCAECGTVDATSVMVVTGDHLMRSVGLLGEWKPRSNSPLRLGLHLTLTSQAGLPLVATRASGLVGRDGRFLSLAGLYARCAAGRVSRAAIAEELAAQWEKFVAVLSHPPAHLDGHHHAHQLPVVREVVAEWIAGRPGLPVRSTVEPPETWRVGGARLRRRVIRQLGKAARPLFAAAGATLTDGFFGVLSDRMLTPPSSPTPPDPFTAYLDAMPRTGPMEMMVHPGREDAELAGRDTYLAGRVAEWRALTDRARHRPSTGSATM